MASKDITQRIREKVSILSYLQDKGYTPIEKSGGRYYTLKEHDSFIYTPARAQFIWNSRSLQGSIIDLYMELEGVSQACAISELSCRVTGHFKRNRKNHSPQKQAVAQQKPTSKAKKIRPTYQPQWWRNVYAYLLKTRSIDTAVVDWCIKNKIIYPAQRADLPGMPLLYYYAAGYASESPYAAARSTYSNNKLFSVVDGSNCDCRFSINLVHGNTTTLFVAEAFIDLLSIMSLLHAQKIDFTQFAYLSLEGSTAAPLRHHLQHNQQLTTIYLAQDNDNAGAQSRSHCRDILSGAAFQGCVHDLVPPSPAKDWNDICRQTEKELTYVLTGLQQSV